MEDTNTPTVPFGAVDGPANPTSGSGTGEVVKPSSPTILDGVDVEGGTPPAKLPAVGSVPWSQVIDFARSSQYLFAIFFGGGDVRATEAWLKAEADKVVAK